MALHHKGIDHLLGVGTPTPHGDPVLLIFEAANAPIFYVCTVTDGVGEGVPLMLGLKDEGHVIDFDGSGPRHRKGG